MAEIINKKQDNVITIDGPAGSGKSTIAKLLSKKLGLIYIDTGATYRTLTLLALRNNIDPEDEKSILSLAKNAKIELESNPEDPDQYTTVKLNGMDVTKEIRSKEVGATVSIVSRLSDIRKYLVKLQRDLAGRGASVLEGRDTGSVVFPDAVLKIYLTADVSERVKRREKQNLEKGHEADKVNIKEEIEKRDHIDSSRKDSPLKIPEDAVVINNTGMSIEDTFIKIRDLYYEKIYSSD